MQQILAIIAEHNDSSRPLGKPRVSYLDSLLALVEPPEILTVIGIRRCGKSTLMQQLQIELHKRGIARKEETIYINFEDPRLAEIDSATKLVELIQAIGDKCKGAGRLYLFLDEIDQVVGWEQALNLFYEQRAKIKFVISGSNSEMSTGRLATVLSGRYLTLRVYPLSFQEYLEFSPNKFSEIDAVKDYLEWGGFPRVVMEQNSYVKTQILANYLDTIAEKDLIVRHSIRKPAGIKALLKYVCLNSTRLFSSYNLSKVLSITDTTVNKYLSHMEQAFIIDRVVLYSPSVKKQLYNPDKLILADNGLAKIAGFSGGGLLGQMLENRVGQTLLQKFPKNLYYWKNGAEVDYAAITGEQLTLYNIAVSADDDTTFLREKRALSEALKKFPSATPKLITLINALGRKDAEIESAIGYI